MTRERASNARLEPGEHSIDRGHIYERESNGKNVMTLDWTVRLHDGRVVRKRTKGATESIVRRRARAKAEELLASTSPQSVKLQRLADEIAALTFRERKTLCEMLRTERRK